MRIFLPYAKLVSEHLGMLLLVARILTVIGWLTVLLAVCLTASSLSSAIWRQYGILSAIPVFICAFGFLVVGGVLAALVAIEENLRRRARGF